MNFLSILEATFPHESYMGVTREEHESDLKQWAAAAEELLNTVEWMREERDQWLSRTQLPTVPHQCVKALMCISGAYASALFETLWGLEVPTLEAMWLANHIANSCPGNITGVVKFFIFDKDGGWSGPGYGGAGYHTCTNNTRLYVTKEGVTFERWDADASILLGKWEWNCQGDFLWGEHSRYDWAWRRGGLKNVLPTNGDIEQLARNEGLAEEWDKKIYG